MMSSAPTRTSGRARTMSHPSSLGSWLVRYRQAPRAGIVGFCARGVKSLRWPLPFALLALSGATTTAARTEDVDVLLRGGTIIDGTGSPPHVGDLAIRGDRIVFIGDASSSNLTPKRTIDVRGLVVSPGFIDPHTHTAADLTSPDERRRANLPYLMQGVTTVVTNNDGGGTTEIGATFAAWTTNGIGTNAALYVPQGSVR